MKKLKWNYLVKSVYSSIFRYTRNKSLCKLTKSENIHIDVEYIPTFYDSQIKFNEKTQVKLSGEEAYILRYSDTQEINHYVSSQRVKIYT